MVSKVPLTAKEGRTIIVAAVSMGWDRDCNSSRVAASIYIRK